MRRLAALLVLLFVFPALSFARGGGSSGGRGNEGRACAIKRLGGIERDLERGALQPGNPAHLAAASKTLVDACNLRPERADCYVDLFVVGSRNFEWIERECSERLVRDAAGALFPAVGF